jgi:Cu/Ag efflux protein CusF
MDAMTMAYAVDKPDELRKLKPGDHIEATVYQDEYKLYNIKVTGQK